MPHIFCAGFVVCNVFNSEPTEGVIESVAAQLDMEQVQVALQQGYGECHYARMHFWQGHIT